MTVALLYLLGRMPEQDEEAYENRLLECRRFAKGLRFKDKADERAKVLPAAASAALERPK